MKWLSSLTACVLGSLKFLIAVDLVILLGWTLCEIFWSILHNPQYQYLAYFVMATLAALIALTLWRWVEPGHFGAIDAANGSLNLIPVAILDAAMLWAAIEVSDRLNCPLTTPLLMFFQTMVHKFTS